MDASRLLVDSAQFHFARIIAQSMCLAVPKFRVIRGETDRTIRLVQLPIDLGYFAQNNEILVMKLCEDCSLFLLFIKSIRDNSQN